MKTIAGFVAVMCGCALGASLSHAQFPGGNQFGRGPTPFSRPTVSPYLNLLQSGNPAINYYGLVRPQFAYDRAFQNVGANLNTLGNNVNSLDANQLTQTGHRSSFMTQGQYFMTNGAAGGNTLANQQARPGATQGGQSAGQAAAQRAIASPALGR